MIPNDILLNPLCALLSHHQKSFFLPQVETNTDRDKILYIESETLKHSHLNMVSPSNPFLQGSGNPT